MPVLQFNGTATTTPATVTFNNEVSTSIFVQNVDNGANNILVSFDGGTTFKTLANMWDFISVDVNMTSVVIKTSAGSKLYEIVVTV